MQEKLFFLVPVTAALVATFALVACDNKPADTTAGQKMDSAIAKAEQKTDKVVNSASSKMKDAAITTSVNAELARDTSLSALKINVDTNAGRVALKGTAPDSAARDRATQLAKKVDGVVAVENLLEIKTN
ncbi:MAG: BON domain-containing protein [Burkholderiaceae bacterium]